LSESQPPLARRLLLRLGTEYVSERAAGSVSRLHKQFGEVGVEYTTHVESPQDPSRGEHRRWSSAPPSSPARRSRGREAAETGDAVGLIGNRLLRIRTIGSTLTGKGHDRCAEFADLRSHYPQYASRDPGQVNATCPGMGGYPVVRGAPGI